MIVIINYNWAIEG